MRYSTLLDIVCDLRGPSEKRSTVASRFKQWQRMGVPRGSQIGRGLKCDYTHDMVWEVLLINELTLLGFPAQTARDYVHEYWAVLVPNGCLNNGVGIILPIRENLSSIVLDRGRLASAIEARRAETQSGSVEDESAVPKADAQ